MKFTMTAPCPHCPFRTDVTPYLSSGRCREILTSITDRQQTFACHETTKFDDDDDEHVPSAGEQHCAGALILLEKIDRPNQMMRISERFGMYDRRKLKMDSPVYSTPSAMRAAYRGSKP